MGELGFILQGSMTVSLSLLCSSLIHKNAHMADPKHFFSGISAMKAELFDIQKTEMFNVFPSVFTHLRFVLAELYFCCNTKKEQLLMDSCMQESIGGF